MGKKGQTPETGRKGDNFGCLVGEFATNHLGIKSLVTRNENNVCGGKLCIKEHLPFAPLPDSHMPCEAIRELRRF
jgi:hypothetical protein